MESTLYHSLVSEDAPKPWWQRAWVYVKSVLSVPPASTQSKKEGATATRATGYSIGHLEVTTQGQGQDRVPSSTQESPYEAV